MNRKNMEACARFVARLRAVLIELGCKPATRGIYSYTLETRAGTLRVSVHPNSAQVGAWVATLFEEPKKATELLGHGAQDSPNPYSGKWNHHFFDDNFSTDDSISAAEAHLRREFASVLGDLCEICDKVTGNEHVTHFSDDRCNEYGRGLCLCPGCATRLLSVPDEEYLAQFKKAPQP